MIDIHTHILPGLDDGARDMEDSLSMAALALKSGVHTLVATSHANTGGFFKEYSIEEYLQRLEAFRKALDEVKLPLRVFSGMEIYMTREVPRMIREGRLLSLNQTGYFLTEFSFGIEQEEMDEMLQKLIESCVPKSNQKLVRDLISNEAFHYIQPKHNTVFIDKMWKIGEAIHSSRYIEIDYQRTKDHAIVHRKVKPLAIMFSEYYFYLTAFIDDEDVRKDFDVLNDSFPTIYRIDRIKDLKISEERFHIQNASR